METSDNHCPNNRLAMPVQGGYLIYGHAIHVTVKEKHLEVPES